MPYITMNSKSEFVCLMPIPVLNTFCVTCVKNSLSTRLAGRWRFVSICFHLESFKAEDEEMMEIFARDSGVIKCKTSQPSLRDGSHEQSNTVLDNKNSPGYSKILASPLTANTISSDNKEIRTYDPLQLRWKWGTSSKEYESIYGRQKGRECMELKKKR